jgi:hypothetical protein
MYRRGIRWDLPKRSLLLEKTLRVVLRGPDQRVMPRMPGLHQHTAAFGASTGPAGDLSQ